MEVKSLSTQIKLIPLSKLRVNSGQVVGLPENPRIIKDYKFKSLVKSIKDDPEFIDLRELIVFPQGELFVVIAGNMRFRAMQELKYKEAPCKVLREDVSVEKLKAITIKDNGSWGENDWSLLANEWSDSPLVDWGAMKTDYSFEPNLSPESSQAQITDADIAKAGTKLSGAFTEGHTEFIEVCCPKCANVFDIKKS